MSCEQYFANPLWSFRDTNIFGPCSGNGECVDGKCVCNQGWTGLSDWVNAEGYDCQINIAAYRIEWAIILSVQIIAILISIPYLRARYTSYMEIKALKKKKGETYSLMDNRGALGMVLWYGIGAPSIIIMSLVKIFAPNQRVGITYGASIMFCIIRITFYLCYVLFQPSLLEAVLSGSKSVDKTNILEWNRHVSYAFFGFQFFAAFLPFIVIAKPELNQTLYLVSSFILFSTGMWIMGQAFYVLHHVGRTLDQSYAMSPQEKTLVMKKKLKDMQRVPTRQAPIVGLLYLVCFIWPFLWTKHDYILPVSFIVFINLGLKTAKTSISENETRSLNGASEMSQKSEKSENDASAPDDSGVRSKTVKSMKKGTGMRSDVALSFVQARDNEYMNGSLEDVTETDQTV